MKKYSSLAVFSIYLLLDITNKLEENLLDILEQNLCGEFGEIYFGKTNNVILSISHIFLRPYDGFDLGGVENVQVA